MEPLPSTSLAHLGCYGLPKKVLAQASRCFPQGATLLKFGYARTTDGRHLGKLADAGGRATQFTLTAALDAGRQASMPPHLHPLYGLPLMDLVRHLLDRACGMEAETYARQPRTSRDDVNDRLAAAYVQAGRLDVDPHKAWSAVRTLFHHMQGYLKTGWQPGFNNAYCGQTRRRTTPRAFYDACKRLRSELNDEILFACALWGAYAILETISGTPDVAELGRQTPYTETDSLTLAAKAHAEAERHALDAAV